MKDELNEEHGPEMCNDPGCSLCCEHNEVDHFVCMDCGEELDPGAFIDTAMDRFED